MSAILFSVRSATLLGLYLLTACATGPKRGGPSGDDGQRAQRGSQASGVMARPIGLYFAGLDANQNGQTTRDEVQVGLTRDWASFGRPPSAIAFRSWSESALGSAEAVPTFLSFDQNLNGTVSANEFEIGLMREFDRMDANSDNRLSRSEMVFTIQERRQSRQSRGLQDGGLSQRGGGGRLPR